MEMFFKKYFVSYFTYLIKANGLITKKALQAMIEDLTIDEAMRSDLLKTLRETPIDDLRKLADKSELDGIECYLENAWSDNPDQTIRNADTSGLEDLIVKVLDIKADESVLEANYNEGRLMLEMVKSQPAAQFTGIDSSTPQSTVAHIKFQLSDATINEEPNTRWHNLWQKESALQFDKIVKMPGQESMMTPWSDFSSLLSDEGKAIFFVGQKDLVANATSRAKPLSRLIADGKIEAVILLSDDFDRPASRVNQDGLAMVVISHHNKKVRIVDATELCAPPQEGEGPNLRTVVPKGSVDEIMRLLSDDSPLSTALSLDEILKAGSVLDPQLFPLCRNMNQVVPLSAIIGGRAVTRRSALKTEGNGQPTRNRKGRLLIGAQDLQDGTIVSGLELLDGKQPESKSDKIRYAALSPEVEDNCVLIPLMRDEETGRLSAGEAVSVSRSSSEYTYIVDDTILLIKVNASAADASAIAEFLNSKIGQRLMAIALKRSERYYQPEGSMFYTQFSKNVLIDADLLKPNALEALNRPRNAPRSSADGKVESSLFSTLMKAYRREEAKEEDAGE